MSKESDKKNWEKERRNRLKHAFDNLEKLLPSYDPSNTATRIDVLTKSIDYIQEMQNKIQDLLKPSMKINAEVLQLKKLQERVKRLIGRNELLTGLLKTARIPIPPQGASLKTFKYVKKWSGKIDEKSAINFLKGDKMKGIEKENKIGIDKKVPSKTLNETSQRSNAPAKNNKLVGGKLEYKNKIRGKLKNIQGSKTNCVIFYTQACQTQPPCFLVTNAPSNRSGTPTQTVLTNSILMANPVMSTSSTNIKTRKKAEQNNKVPKLSTLGSGILILASNNTVYPILPQTQTPSTMLLPVPRNVTPSIQTHQNKTNVGGIIKTINSCSINSNVSPMLSRIASLPTLPSSSNTSSLSKIKPISRIQSKCLTKTTQVNKVPISSLILNSSVNNNNYYMNKRPISKPYARKNLPRDRPMSRVMLRKLRKANCKSELEKLGKSEKQNKTKQDQVIVKSQVTTALPIENSAVNIPSTSTIDPVTTNTSDDKGTKIDVPEVSSVGCVTDSNKTGISILSNSVLKTAENEVNTVSDNSLSIKIGIDVFVQENDKMNSFSNDPISISNEAKVNSEINSSSHTDYMSSRVKEVENLQTSSNDLVPPKITTINLDIKDNSEQITNVIQEQHESDENSDVNKDVTDIKESIEGSDANQITGIDMENVCNMNQHMKSLDLQLGHSELSNDIFASLQVPTGCQNPESTSPTAAFLLAFPLVSSLTGVKVTEVMDDDNPDSQRETPTLLQIGNLDSTKLNQSDNFTPNLLNLDFFSSKDIYTGFYNSFEQHLNSLTSSTNNYLNDIQKGTEKLGDSMNNIKVTENMKVSHNMDNVQTPTLCKEDLDNTVPSQLKIKNCNSNNNSAITKNIISETNVGVSEKPVNAPHKNLENLHSKHIDMSAQKITNTKNNDTTQTPPKILFLNQNPNEQNSSVPKLCNIFTANDSKESSALKRNHESKSLNPQATPQKNMKHTPFNDFNMHRNIVSRSSTQVSENIFQFDNKQLEPIRSQETIDLNLNFLTDKPILPLQKSLSEQHFPKTSASIQTTLQYNLNNPFMENKSVTTMTSQSSLSQNIFNSDTSVSSFAQKNLNYNSAIKPADSVVKDIPYFSSENKNFGQNNVHNSKNPSSNLLHKNTGYNHFNVDNRGVTKTIEKTGDMNLSFNIENRVPIQKSIDTKQMLPNYNMVYPNINYDLNCVAKTSACTFSSTKNYPDPLYTNSNNNNSYNYYVQSENFLNENCYKQTRNDKTNASIDFGNYNDYKRTDFGNTYYPDNFKKSSNKLEYLQEKPTYNWMTTPAKTSLDHIMPNFSKEDAVYSTASLMSNSQTTYFNTSTVYTGEINSNFGSNNKKSFDLQLPNINSGYQKNEMEENQFNWSPTKLPQFLDPVPNFVSSTLPTLVGDLALGTSNFTSELEFSNRTHSNKDAKSKNASKCNYDNQNNFFSVSQLVHQNEKSAPAKTVRRRNSSSGSKGTTIKVKKIPKVNDEPKDIQQCFNKSSSQSHAKNDGKNFTCRPSNNIFCDGNKRNTLKVSSSNYSAEALIGHQGQADDSKKDHGFNSNTMKNVPVPPFLSDNIMPYFPVDLQQDSYIQYNQNYQNISHNFTSFSNNNHSSNSFIPSCTISTPYLSTTTFMSDVSGSTDFSTDNINLVSNPSGSSKDGKYKTATKNISNGREEKNSQNNSCSNNMNKKVKRKMSHDNNVHSNLVDFSFLSVPGSINSPLLPDDFHSHATFLPPPPTQPQLYPCKNPLYPAKQSNICSTGHLLPLPPLPTVTRSGIQHPEVSPLNSAGTSLTNFNLSTIFPEMNKNDMYSETRVKDQPVTRNYSNNSVPHNSKPISSYSNCQGPQVYGIENR